jgi:dimethylargininase
VSGRSYRFTHAITRTPPQSAVDGLRADDVGNPDVQLMRQHHEIYVEALRATGAEVQVLEALEEFPDSHFVEDSALCLQEGAVVLRPGAPSRFGESAAMAPHLEALYGDVRYLQGPGFIEGGDILTTEREILVGRSARTDAAGIAELADAVRDWGYSVREVVTPPGVLHFKTDCSLLDENTILSTPTLSASGCFVGYTVIDVEPGEEPAANSIRFNGIVFMPEGFPITTNRVREAGFSVVTVPNGECQKIDGGLSCLSLRFSPS